ncbi:hypothetical protein LTS08_002138 [Lithohypha guttulata]|nr:hypothetical protein LTS08_002138 [Lithohypha guttulata]
MLSHAVAVHGPEEPSKTPAQPLSVSPTQLEHTPWRSKSRSSGLHRRSIVAASSHDAAIASLITNLTATSNSDHLSDKPFRNTTPAQQKTPDRFVSNISIHPAIRKFYEHKNPRLGLAGSEQDFCPPPVAGYNTINAGTQGPNTPTSTKPLRRFKDRKSRVILKSTASYISLRAAESFKDLDPPEPSPPIRPSTSYGNDSVNSLPLSTHSKLSRPKNRFRMFFSQGSSIQSNRVLPDGLSHHDDDLSTNTSSPEKEKDLHFSAFVTLGRISTDVDRKEADTKTLSSASPSLHSSLNESLIPCRRSSLRSARRQSVRNSRDLKSLNIDQDLIEENHETVQRIRQLQEQREKRHKEWRKEERRSEKAARHMSMPIPDPDPVLNSGALRSSWHPKIESTPEVKTVDGEEPPTLSATLTAEDLSSLPAFLDISENETLTRLEKPPSGDVDGTITGLRRDGSVTPSTTQSVSSIRRPQKRLSDSIRRASSIRQPVSIDTKTVSDDVESFLSSPRLNQKIRHPRTGRTIAFSEIGDPNGFVVFCCVGMGLTRYVTTFYDETAKTQKLRIITPDRPGVAGTDAMPAERTTPLAWVDDVAVICIEKFSLLAHSAGSIYALATALKMPQYVRGRIHLLAPWIPPSQLAISGQSGSSKAASLPTSHKLLSILPTSFMKAANSRFLSAASASIEPRTRKGRLDLRDSEVALNQDPVDQGASVSQADIAQSNGSMLSASGTTPHRVMSDNLTAYQAERMRMGSPALSSTSATTPRSSAISPTLSGKQTPNGTRSHHQVLTPEARQRLYNETLTYRTWSLATLNANPATDLVICLERRRPIGFRYTDITRAVVIHHGTNDTRVPLENVQWLDSAMKRCELRVLEGEGHGLMASATVMTNVLSEIGKEWEEWSCIAKVQEQKRKEEQARERGDARERERRKGYPRW